MKHGKALLVFHALEIQTTTEPLFLSMELVVEFLFDPTTFSGDETATRQTPTRRHPWPVESPTLFNRRIPQKEIEVKSPQEEQQHEPVDMVGRVFSPKSKQS